MRVSGWKSVLAAAVAIFWIGILLSAAAKPPRLPLAQSPAGSQEVILSFDPAHCKVRWMVDSTLHTVHGTFNVRSGSVHFERESGKAEGEIIVLATSGESGNSSRDEKMHKEVLQMPFFDRHRLKARWLTTAVPTSKSTAHSFCTALLTKSAFPFMQNLAGKTGRELASSTCPIFSGA
jgi:hypothetical protein